MQIGLSNVSTLPVQINRRDELSDRRHNGRRESDAVAAASQGGQAASQRGEVTRIRTRPSVAAQSADNSFSKFADNLPARARNAVAAYSSNGPSIVERLGVELVGVDTYA